MIQPNKLLPPVATWALLQLVLLGIGASGIPLWAHHPLPRESLAFPIMLCGQVLIFSMLVPILAKTGWVLAINLVLTVPFDQLGGLLSNVPQLMIAKSWGCVGVWMIGLRLWRNYQFIRTFATLFTAGGAVLDYLRWEVFLGDGRQNAFTPRSLLPNLCVMDWSMALPQAALPVTTALIALLLTTLVRRKNATPLPPTQLEMPSKTKI